jgi:hypothetical protein
VSWSAIIAVNAADATATPTETPIHDIATVHARCEREADQRPGAQYHSRAPRDVACRRRRGCDRSCRRRAGRR